MRRRRTLVLLAAAILTWSSTGVVRAREGGRDVRLSPELRYEGLATGNSVPVIVHLDAPEDALAVLSPRSTDGDRRRSEALEPVFRQVLGRLTTQIDPQDLSDVRPFALQPAFSAVASPAGLGQLLAEPAVRFVEPDRRYRAHTQEGLDMVGAFQLHNLGYSGAGTAVAIIDTGIDYLHPTLGGAAMPNAKVVHGRDTADQDDDPMDCGAHGTAVASVAAGTSFQWNPQRRFAGGVAPQAKILAYKASPDADCGVFAQSAVIAAIEDALVHRTGDGYQLAAINLSFGSGAFSGPCDAPASSWSVAVAAATQAGVAVVASAGNEGLADAMSAPACLAEVISVGSVWDTDPGLVSFSFCLDPACATVCNDSFKPAGAVTCYSNAGALLDVFAPSEFLRAARAGDETSEFGGTSGAAAYVTGALALVRQADPALSPGEARRLLQLTGVPTLDRRSGLVRPRIHLARALAAAGEVLASPDPALTIPDLAGVPLVSSLEVTRQGRIGSVRVLLNLAHPAPEELRVVITSPDGTTVRLHDRTAGTIAGAPGSPTASPAVWGVYPDDIAPVDSLGLFGGGEMFGTWILQVFDEVPGNGGTSPASLVGWAIRVEEADPPDGLDAEIVTIPVVANAPGVRGSTWISDVRVLNPSPGQAATGRLYLVPSGADGTVDFAQSELVVPPLTVVDLPNLVSLRFAEHELRGALRLQADLPGLIATSRTFTMDASGGSYGQYIGSVAPDTTTALGENPLLLFNLSDTSAFRANVGFTEVSGRPALLEMTLFDGNGGASVLQVTRREVQPFSNVQLRLSSESTAENRYALVHVVAGEGRIFAYSSTVDNVTGDATFVPAVRPTEVAELMLPVVARTGGQSGTDWRTELRVANPGVQPVELQLEFRARQGDTRQPVTASRIVAGAAVLLIDDVVENIFGLSRAVGSLRVTTLSGPSPISVSARIYNASQGGSYGQFVGPVGGTGRSAAVIHADSTVQTRTNLGVCEVGGGSVTVRATVRDAFGRALGDPLLLTADPHQLVQVDDVFRAVGQESASNAWIELEMVAGDGAFVGYGSMVDSSTGDAIFVPSRPLPQLPPPYPEP